MNNAHSKHVKDIWSLLNYYNNYYIPLCTVILYTWYNIKILHRGGYFSASGNIKYFPSNDVFSYISAMSLYGSHQNMQ